MKIAFVTPGGVDRSGRERVIPVLLWLLERLARQHEVHVFVLNQYAEPCSYPLLGTSVHNLGEQSLRRNAQPGTGFIKVWFSLLSGLRMFGPFDLLHGFWGGSPGLLAALSARWTGCPSVVSLAGGELVGIREIGYGSQLTWRGRSRVAWSVRLADRVTVASGTMHALAASRRIKAEIVPLGVAPVFFTAGRSMSGQPPWRLLHVASLNQVKDPATLIKALKIVSETAPGVHLDVIGEDTLKGSIQQLSADLGLGEQVTFHGFLPLSSIHPYYQKADLCVMASRHEAGPLVALEAAACGVPTIGTPVGHLADWAPERAWSVPIGDAPRLADGILTLLRNAHLRENLGRAAQQWAKTYDADWTARRFQALYEELLGA
jgi:glycosyltransferase involved in cell wall biosynthesis